MVFSLPVIVPPASGKYEPSAVNTEPPETGSALPPETVPIVIACVWELVVTAFVEVPVSVPGVPRVTDPVVVIVVKFIPLPEATDVTAVPALPIILPFQ